MDGLELRTLTDPLDMVDVDALYRRTFGIADGDNGLNLRLLLAIATNGGHVVGAWDGDRLIGFGLSFLARDDAATRLLRYSQTVAIEPSLQARGIGRAIKYAQRDAALADGIELLRWVYDPMQARNAHFNLDVLGGRVRRLQRDLYGHAAPGRDSGERTDRLVVDWELRAPADPVAAEPPRGLRAGESLDAEGLFAVAIPADWYAYRSATSASAAARLRDTTAGLIAGAFERGLAAVSCRRTDDDVAVYLFAADPALA